MKKVLLIWIILAFLFCNGPEKGIGIINTPENDTAQVLATINNVFAWAIDKDFKRFYKSISNDSSFISVTPYKRVKFGFAEVRKDSAFWGNPAFKAISHQIMNLSINFSKDGTVAWFFCILNGFNTMEDKPVNWENTRWTGILEKQHNEWRVMQQHFSFEHK